MKKQVLRVMDFLKNNPKKIEKGIKKIVEFFEKKKK